MPRCRIKTASEGPTIAAHPAVKLTTGSPDRGHLCTTAVELVLSELPQPHFSIGTHFAFCSRMHLTTLLNELEARYGSPIVQHDGFTTYRWSIAAKAANGGNSFPSNPSHPVSPHLFPPTHLIVSADLQRRSAIIFIFDPTKPPHELRFNRMDDLDKTLLALADLLT